MATCLHYSEANKDALSIKALFGCVNLAASCSSLLPVGRFPLTEMSIILFLSCFLWQFCGYIEFCQLGFREWILRIWGESKKVNGRLMLQSFIHCQFISGVNAVSLPFWRLILIDVFLEHSDLVGMRATRKTGYAFYTSSFPVHPRSLSLLLFLFEQDLWSWSQVVLLAIFQSILESHLPF